jgi:organic radical activating enzyme/glutaredoxin-related protein
MLGNLNTHSIDQVLNSPVLQQVRANLAQGIPHEYCSNCVNRETQGAESERSWHNQINEGFDYSTAGNNYHYPSLIDVRWNTTCNLSCNYCDSGASSKWAALKGIPFVAQTRHYYNDVCDLIETHKQHVKEVALVGGEPLLLPENNRLLDVIPESAKVTVITNLTIDLENNKIFNKLCARDNVGWSMSFDNIGEEFEYVRYGAQWEKFLKNLDQIQNLFATKNHWGGIHSVYSLFNATKLCKFKQFAQSRGLSIVWQPLKWPESLSIYSHGSDIGQVILEEIQQFKSSCNATAQEIEMVNSVEKHFQTVDINPDAKNKFKQFIHDLENKYHTDRLGDFARLWPEIYNLL